MNLQNVKDFKKAHALNRLMERFGISISEDEYQKIVTDIEAYNPPPLFIEKDGRSFHLFEVQGHEVIFLYDWEDQVLITAYRTSWFQKDKNGNWKKFFKGPQAKLRRGRDRVRTMKFKLTSDSL